MQICRLYSSWNNSEAGRRNGAIVIAIPEQNTNSIYYFLKNIQKKHIKYDIILPIFKAQS